MEEPREPCAKKIRIFMEDEVNTEGQVGQNRMTGPLSDYLKDKNILSKSLYLKFIYKGPVGRKDLKFLLWTVLSGALMMFEYVTDKETKESTTPVYDVVVGIFTSTDGVLKCEYMNPKMLTLENVINAPIVYGKLHGRL